MRKPPRQTKSRASHGEEADDDRAAARDHLAADGGIVCHLHPSKRASSHEHYGLLICDLGRHVARAFKVDEAEVWKWVEKVRHNASIEVTSVS